MPASDVDLTTVGQIAGAVSGAITPVVLAWLLITGRLVRGAELEEAKRTIAAKDEKLDAARDALMEKAIPVLTKAITVMESYHVEETARRS